jgi:hypothetical protein
MMARPRGPTSTTDRIDWREARYLARVVQLLVTSPTDKAEFKRELDYLVSAAEALRTGVPPPRGPGFDRAAQADPDDRTASEAEGAVLALWRANPSAVREGTEGGRDESMRRRLCVWTNPLWPRQSRRSSVQRRRCAWTNRL